MTATPRWTTQPEEPATPIPHEPPSPRRADFERDGFLVRRDFVSVAACQALTTRAGELQREFDAASHRSIFTTHEQARTSDDYFLSSGEAIRVFFEEEAFDDRGALRQPVELSMNKIGHALRELDPVFARFSRQRKKKKG